MTMLRVEGGRIAEGWNAWDRIPMLTAMGAIPSPNRPPE